MRGLLTIEPLYHQIVSGSKTQTRRSGGLEAVNDTCTEMNGHVRSPDDWHKGRMYRIETDSGEVLLNQMFRSARNPEITLALKPRYRVGEVMYLKEPFVFLQSDKTDFWNGYAYKFGARSGTAISERGCELGGPDFKWKNKLFMPSSAARAFIKITGIRCERLLDISDEDCIAEGIEMGYAGDSPFGYINYLMTSEYGYDYIDNTPKESFISLYKLANKLAKVGSVPPHGSLPTPPGVDNLWVWVYEFEYLPNYIAV